MNARAPLTLVLVATIGCDVGTEVPMVPTLTVAADCRPCGPNLCLNDPRHTSKLLKKKAALKRDGYPDDLIALLDRDGQCVMAVDESPDIFTLLLVKPNGSGSYTIEWTKQNEDIAKTKVLAGELKEYYKFNARSVLACCGELRAEDRPDWDSKLSLRARLKRSRSVG